MAPIVRRIFTMRGEGASQGDIARATGVEVLDSCGTSCTLGSTSAKCCCEASGIPGKHEPIITPEDFERAHRGRVPGRRRGKDMLSGRVRCGRCGQAHARRGQRLRSPVLPLSESGRRLRTPPSIDSGTASVRCLLGLAADRSRRAPARSHPPGVGVGRAAAPSGAEPGGVNIGEGSRCAAGRTAEAVAAALRRPESTRNSSAKSNSGSPRRSKPCEPRTKPKAQAARTRCGRRRTLRGDRRLPRRSRHRHNLA